MLSNYELLMYCKNGFLSMIFFHAHLFRLTVIFSFVPPSFIFRKVEKRMDFFTQKEKNRKCILSGIYMRFKESYKQCFVIFTNFMWCFKKLFNTAFSLNF